MWRRSVSAHHCNTLSNLFLLIARSLHAMSIRKKPVSASSLDCSGDSVLVKPVAKHSLVQGAVLIDNLNKEESPVCPILSQSSMELLNKYK